MSRWRHERPLHPGDFDAVGLQRDYLHRLHTQSRQAPVRRHRDHERACCKFREYVFDLGLTEAEERAELKRRRPRVPEATTGKKTPRGDRGV
jgi:hypothetical protein